VDSQVATAIRNDILDFLAEGVEQPSDDARFDELALRVFEYQFRLNEPYRRFCLRRGKTPETVKHWREIPAIPTSAFKELPLTCFPVEEASVVFMTSGTTRGQTRGKHYLRSLELYEASLKPNFRAHLLPEGGSMRMLVLGPSPRFPSPNGEGLGASPEDMAHSSLGHMFKVVVEEWGAEGSAFFMEPDGLDLQGFASGLRRAQEENLPVCLLGTSFGFLHFFDYCREKALRFTLPPGSRLMDTGGFKGRTREVTRQELYRMAEELLAIPEDHCVNEYGMTEMGSQFYDNVLRDAKRGVVQRPRHKVIVPWVRTLVIDPETLEEASPGRTGLLRHFDLANVDSVMALQTEDLGYAIDDGFEIVGRVPGADVRGCSLVVEELW